MPPHHSRTPICRACTGADTEAPVLSQRGLKSAAAVRRLRIYLIKPSKYDDEGYVIRYWRGVLPSNTLACLHGLTEDVRDRQALGANLAWHIETIDEPVQKVDVQKILRAGRQKNTHTIACLVGVQSNQFPRASDLALELKKGPIDVMMGGFHISGILATLPELPADLQRLRDAGVILVAGEIEHRWENILRDALQNRLEPIYNFLKEAPDLAGAPLPKIPKNLLKRYVISHFATLDCGRGCPFQCSFCTVIHVQGRKMRFRQVDRIINWIRQNYLEQKISYYFFTDDNFSRNKHWEKIFDRLIEMRTKENIAITFMMQVDTQSHRIPNFTEKAGRAGCRQAFIGMESLNSENLRAAGKNQNKVHEFRSMIQAYQADGISAYLAYIIGFPFDTIGSVRQNIEDLQELDAELASFFVLSPLPGSTDFRNAHENGLFVDADLNNYDTFHQTFRHSQMTPDEWAAAYDFAWKKFYHPDYLKRVLKNTPPARYWNVFLNFLWHKNAIEVEKGHPMVHGFFRFKDRLTRRAIFPRENLWHHFKNRLRERIETVRAWAKLLLELEEIWLVTRPVSRLEQNTLRELSKMQASFRRWRKISVSALISLYRGAANPFVKSRAPSRLQILFKRWNLFSIALLPSRKMLNRFWHQTKRRIQRGQILKINFWEVFLAGIREAALLTRFVGKILHEIGFYYRDEARKTSF